MNIKLKNQNKDIVGIMIILLFGLLAISLLFWYCQ